MKIAAIIALTIFIESIMFIGGVVGSLFLAVALGSEDYMIFIMPFFFAIFGFLTIILCNWSYNKTMAVK